MKRRDFIAGLVAAASWSVATQAQEPGQMLRIGALMAYAESDREGQARIAAFREARQKLGTDKQKLRQTLTLNPSLFASPVSSRIGPARQPSSRSGRYEHFRWATCTGRDVAK